MTMFTVRPLSLPLTLQMLVMAPMIFTVLWLYFLEISVAAYKRTGRIAAPITCNCTLVITNHFFYPFGFRHEGIEFLLFLAFLGAGQ